LIYGPLAPAQFRMDGHGSQTGADRRFAAAAAAFGRDESPEIAAEERSGLEFLAARLHDEPWLAELLGKTPPVTDSAGGQG
jgi:hypothetical protein